MKNKYKVLLFAGLMLCILIAYMGCTKEDVTVGPTTNTNPNASTYPVTVTVLGPSGAPQGGVTVTLQNPPRVDSIFTAITNSLGIATIQAPAGSQVIIATMGTVFQATMNVTVNASTTGTIISTPIKLVQVTTTNKKVLVVQADAEQLEDVLRVIGFATFDSTYIDTLMNKANIDSNSVLNYLKQYSIVFSDCDGGTEGEDSYAALSRTYGRYVAQGGKMYGGHYNYYHLQRIWSPYYTIFDYQGSSSSNDSILIIDQSLKLALGFTVASWSTSIDSRYLSGYAKFSDLPTNAKVYGVIYGTSPRVGVIVENYQSSGKYLWTDYHNQDIKDDPRLVKIVQYFLLSM